MQTSSPGRRGGGEWTSRWQSLLRRLPPPGRGMSGNTGQIDLWRLITLRVWATITHNWREIEWDRKMEQKYIQHNIYFPCRRARVCIFYIFLAFRNDPVVVFNLLLSNSFQSLAVIGPQLSGWNISNITFINLRAVFGGGFLSLSPARLLSFLREMINIFRWFFAAPRPLPSSPTDDRLDGRPRFLEVKRTVPDLTKISRASQLCVTGRETKKNRVPLTRTVVFPERSSNGCVGRRRRGLLFRDTFNGPRQNNVTSGEKAWAIVIKNTRYVPCVLTLKRSRARIT